MPISVHHLNCGDMRPLGGALAYGRHATHRHLVCHCLLLELPDRLVLVDTGFGHDDLRDPARRLGRAFVAVTRPRLDERETAASRITALGFSPRDVRDIIVTHLDLDHAGGLSDFPEATVHLAKLELDRATSLTVAADRRRYRPIQWAHGPRWAPFEAQGEPWFGFEAIRELPGLPPEVLAVPLLGHSGGHCGIAVQTADQWLLHAGDAYFHRNEMAAEHPSCPSGLALFQRLVADDYTMRCHNVERLRALSIRHRSEATVFSAHDPVEFEALSRA